MSLSLFCLHANNGFHGDLKPDNILFNIKGNNKFTYYLADFGVSKFLKVKLDTYY